MQSKEYHAQYFQANKERIRLRNLVRRPQSPAQQENMRERNKKYRASHRERRLAYSKVVNKRDWPKRKEERKKISDYLWSYKQEHSCIDCHTANPIVLEFDHVRGIKKFHMAKAYQYAFKTVLAEIEKCVLRCANCHRIRTYSLQHAGGGANG